MNIYICNTPLSYMKMEFQKIVNFLCTNPYENLPKFVTEKWMEVYDQSGRNYNVNEEIRIKISMLWSDLCDYCHAYIVVKGTITVVRPDNAKKNKATTFKNNVPFINCISKINGVKTNNAEDLDVVMPMYNLLECSKNYKKARESLCNYYRDEPSNPLCSNSESFKFKTSITGNTYNVGDDKEGYDANKLGKNDISLKHSSNFWKALNLSLISEIELILTLSKTCVLADMTRRNADDPAIVAPAEITPEIKIYCPVVTLSNENDVKPLDKLKLVFNRAIKWNKYRLQMTLQSNNSNLNYLIDRTFTNVNRLFVLSFTRNNAGDNRDSFSHYYVPNVQIKGFNLLIDRKSFFDLPVKNEEEAYEKIIEISKNNDYTIGIVL